LYEATSNAGKSLLGDCFAKIARNNNLAGLPCSRSLPPDFPLKTCQIGKFLFLNSPMGQVDFSPQAWEDGAIKIERIFYYLQEDNGTQEDP
jgi:hypothetical protein